MNYQMLWSSSSYTHHTEREIIRFYSIYDVISNKIIPENRGWIHILHYSPSLKIIGYGKSAQFDALVKIWFSRTVKLCGVFKRIVVSK